MEDKKLKLKVLRIKANELAKKQARLTKEIITLQNSLREEEFKNLLPLTMEKIVTADANIFETDKNYQALKKFTSQFKFVKDSGFWSGNKTKAFQMGFDQTQSLQPQVEELQQFIACSPAQEISYFENNKKVTNNLKLFGLIESTLSEFGSYLLGFNDTHLFLIVTRYSRTSLLKTLPIEEGMKYVYENHPYIKEKSEEYEEEDV